MDLNTREITVDEFREYTGIDLTADLKPDSNPSNTAKAFLMRSSDRLEAFLCAQLFRDPAREYRAMSDFQKEHYKKALIEQALYTYRNGDISTDSGYVPDEGIKASRDELLGLTIAPNAKNHLMVSGMWSRKFRNTGRGAYEWWFR